MPLKPINLYSDGESFYTPGGSSVPPEVQEELNKIIAAENSGNSEDLELLEIAKTIPKDELMKMASKYVARKYAQESLKDTSDTDEDEQEKALKIAMGEEPIQSNKIEKGGENRMNGNASVEEVSKQVIANLQEPLRNMIAEIVKKVVEPPKQSPVNMPNDTAKQEGTVLTDEAVNGATSSYPAAGDVKGEVQDPKLVSKVAEPAKQTSVEMPKSGDMQEGTVLSDEPVKKVAGSSISQSVQKKVVEPPKQSPVDMPNDTKKQEGTVLSDEPVKRAEGSYGAAGTIKGASKVEGEVAKRVVESPQQRDVKEPGNAGKQEEVAIGDIQESPLPGARKVSEPNKTLQLSPITAKFVPKRPLHQSKWIVYSGGTPVFSVRMDQAYKWENIKSRWKDFISPEYGETLVAEIEEKGFVPTINQYYGGFDKRGNIRHATLLTSANEVANPPSVETNEENAVIPNEVQKKLEDKSKAESSPLLKALPIVLSVLFIGKEGEIDSLGDILKDIANDDALLGEIVGEIKSTVKGLGGEKEGEEESLEDIGNKVVSMIRRAGKNEYISKLADYFDLIKDKDSEIKSWESKAKSEMEKVASLKRELEALKNKEKTRKAKMIALAMVKRGMIENSKRAFQEKVAELQNKADETLDEVATTVAAVPIKKEGRKIEAVGTVPVITQQNPILQESAAETKIEGLFSAPPKIDVRNKKVIKQ